MKLSKVLTLFGVTSSLAISNFFQRNLGQVKAQLSSQDALIVFVNGSGDCCAGEMKKVIERVEQGNTVWTTSYANFRNGSTTTKVPVGDLSIDVDALFIKEAIEVINSQPPDRPIILIGHSYDGDSILKVLPFITRRIQLVVVIDPVGTGGLRKVATSRVVPPNVDYFMNRWQENGLTKYNIVPFDSRINGQILCSATKGCDQTAQNLVRNEDGSEVRVSCGWAEVTCRTKAKRIEHNSMPRDAYIQRTVGDRIIEVLAAFRPPAPTPVSGNPTPPTNPAPGSLASLHSSCSGEPQSPDCVAAIHRACNQRGAGGGISQEVGNGVLGVACFDTKWFGDISIDELRTQHSGCDSTGKSQSTDCVAAIHRACNVRGAGGGIAQEVGNGVLGVACFDTKWFGDIPIR